MSPDTAGCAARLLRWGGGLLLAGSLLGWSAWWVICNVYEFAPALPLWPLLAAWGVAAVMVMGRRWRSITALLLAGMNGLAVLQQHRGWIDDAGLALVPLVVAMVAVLHWGRRR